MSITIVFTHPDFYIIDKPAGIGVHNDTQSESHSPGILSYLYEQVEDQQLWLCHRLDRVTSGLLILARNAETAAYFANLFKQRQIQKYYLAVSAKKPNKKQGTVIGDMQPARNGQWKLTQNKTNPAISQFFSQGLVEGKRLILIKPRTGKTHQIRVMLKSLGAPILGDARYGGEESDRTYLHAYSLQFDYQGSLIDVSSTPSDGYFFQLLADTTLWPTFVKPALLPWPAVPAK